MSGGNHEVLNVLVIDDDEGTRQLLVDIISRDEHQVVTASSAEQALGLLPFWTFQVAFVDQGLPGMEGLVISEYLSRNNPDMMIALITGSGDASIERRTRDLAIRYIEKPFMVDAITEVLDAWLEASRERERQSRDRIDPEYHPRIAAYVSDIGDSFAMPRVPDRIEERLVATLRRCLSDLRSARRYSERDRILALSGLLTAQVLQVSLPRTSAGLSLFEEYDEIMRDRGKAAAFSEE
jgi:DNA-binding NtrC family response regulator